MSRPRAKRVGLKDVAQAAGVAVSTASDALNERGRVAAATRQRVRGAAKELGYVPNAAGRGLRAGTSRLIGLALRLDVSAPDRYPVDLYYSLLITACATTALARSKMAPLSMTLTGWDTAWMSCARPGVAVTVTSA